MFTINPTDPAPIWRQIEDGIRRLISLGTLAPGGAVPSMRDLARELRVNPNTVARAYQRLTESGVLIVKRGEGTYVADIPTQPKKAEKSEMLKDASIRYASAAIAVGAELNEAEAALRDAFERVVREYRRRA
jgi:GntR family transcriptional regulator